MIFYPPRKVIGSYGIIFLMLSVFAIYRFSQVHKSTYAVIAALALCIAVYLLMPVLRNPIVEITSNGIIISSFGNKTLLTNDNLHDIEYHHNNIASYQFKKK